VKSKRNHKKAQKNQMMINFKEVKKSIWMLKIGLESIHDLLPKQGLLTLVESKVSMNLCFRDLMTLAFFLTQPELA
jgi:hypothetical protein